MHSVVAMMIGSRAKIACGAIQKQSKITFELPAVTSLKNALSWEPGVRHPLFFVEPAPGVDYGKLKRDIIRKTRQFHSRRYLHEQITNPKLIMVVPSGSLPRTATKGNIRRKAVEEAYQAELDKIYASLQ
jgi:hypothetical protein